MEWETRAEASGWAKNLRRKNLGLL